MNPWIIILFLTAGIVFGLDYIIRRKTWKANSNGEKISLIINMFSVGPYVFLSVLGMLWGIVSYSPETLLGTVLYNATLTMGEFFFVVAVAAVVLSFVFRKQGRIKASIWINAAAFAYMAVVLAVNSLSGKLL